MIFSVLAFIALFVSICIKNRKKSLSVQALNCLFESLYDFTIQAYTGAILGLLNFIRTFIFISKEKFGRAFYILILFIFESVIITNCIFTWSGIISLLPTIGSVIRTYCLWQSNMKLVRFSGITTGVFYGLYYIYYEAWFMVLGYIFLLIITLYSIYKNDVLKQDKS